MPTRALGLLALAVTFAACGCPSSSGGAGADAGPSPDSGPAGPTVFCNGFGLKDGAGDAFFVQTYAFSGEIAADGCYWQVMGTGLHGGWADGQSVPSVGGILDVDVSDDVAESGGVPASNVLFATSCADLGFPDGGLGCPDLQSFTPPDGGQTVAQVVEAQAVHGPVYGVVTAIYPWTPPTHNNTASYGLFYLQDLVALGGTPAPHSGISVYVDPSVVTASVPAAAPPKVGDVVVLTGFTWSPYTGGSSGGNLPGYSNAQFQLTTGPEANLQVAAASCLPPPVTIRPSDAAPGAGPSPYAGMRVLVSGGPFTVAGSQASSDCPPAVEYRSPWSG